MKVRALIMSVFGFDKNKNRVEVPTCDEVPTKEEYEANVCDTGWVELVPITKDNSAYSVTNRPIQYRKKNGVVYIRGEITLFAQTTGTMATLPKDCRPDINLDLRVVGTSGDIKSVVIGSISINYYTGAVSVSTSMLDSTGELATKMSYAKVDVCYPV